jgi:glycosyltransferase involved in cell wall biosynthesis
VNVFHILDERWDSAITAYGLILARAQKARGHSVFVGARAGSFALAEAKRTGLPTFPLGSVFALRRFLRQGGFQIVNAHTGSGHFSGWLGVLGRSIALVRTRGDARPVDRNAGRTLLYKRTDSVIGASRCIAVQYAAAFPFVQDRLSTVYPGLEIPPLAAEPDGPVRVALVGRLDPVKGHEDFLAAIAFLRPQLADEQFLIVGEEKYLRTDDLRRMAELHGVARWVQYMGRLADVVTFMRSCHVGVIASVGSEALSRACLEWMAQGRPVVATAVGCLPELVSSGENGFLIPPRNPQAMANCLAGLIRRADLRRQMGRRAFETASNRFSLSRMVFETEKIYEEALRRRVVL